MPEVTSKRKKTMTTSNARIMHRPLPGPMYWDWRCLTCSEPVDAHASWWQRLVHRRASKKPADA